ncbi:MAG TPA: hypothetical protein P5067_05800 [Candidatus Marinimicrobia bacterium]|nr:hypothetical protein [Candidatus Neomarinimicrobiota bacterium]
MKRKILTVTMLAIFLGTTGFAQLKTQIQKSPTTLEAIQLPGLSSALSSYSLFDPSRFNMQQSYSLSYSTFGNQSMSLGVYQNAMSFLLSDKFLLNTRFGFYHNPLQLGTMNATSNNMLDNLILGADLIYHPRENTTFMIRFDRRPYYSSYGYYNPYFGY